MTTHATPSGKPDAADLFAAHIAATTWDGLSEATRTAVKVQVLDIIACMFAGSISKDAQAVVSLAAHWGGRPCSTVINGGGLKVSPENAMLANGAMTHQHDYDDTHDVAICHPSAGTFPAALAVAEDIGGVSGKALLTAMALGNDLTSRVALGIEKNLVAYPWFRAPVVGIFGATAAAAKVLGANTEQMSEALGLALPQVAGTLASLEHGGSSVRSIRDGVAFRDAVLAASLAMRGVRGDRQVFEGPFGFYHVFFRGEYNRERLVGELGTSCETERISLKPWPSIRHLHRLITALSDVMAEHGLGFDDVVTVTASVGKINAGRCHPLEIGMAPERRIDLLHNLIFALGATLLRGGPNLAIYNTRALADDVILRGAPKIRTRYDAALDGPWTFEPGRLEVATRDGRVLSRSCDIALGSPERPMSTVARHDKLMQAAAAAATPVPEDRAWQIIAAVDRLDRMDDVRELAALLG
jgi:2-methylcitrate dehydratase PrpD